MRRAGHDGGMSASPTAPPVDRPLEDVRTERLDLRGFRRSDLDELAAVFAQPEVWRFPYGRGFTREETEDFIDRRIAERAEVGFSCWVARTLLDGRIVGYVGLSVPLFLPEILPAAEVGWRFAPGAWGQGYATEGASAALDQAFGTLGLDEVVSVPQADNPASCRVAERLGMTRARDVDIPANETRGAVTGALYVLARGDWAKRGGRPWPNG
jgi:RimJ/RimL family protein N-acetyltransferase